MATHKLTDAKIYLAQYDVSAEHNMVELPNGVEDRDRTTFGQTTRIHSGGLFVTAVKGQGFVSYGTGEIESIVHAVKGVADVPLTVAAEGADAGERAYLTKILTANAHVMGGAVGDLHGFAWDAKGSGGVPMVPGTVFAAKSARGATSTSGTPLQIGAVATGKRVYAALHIFAASGGSPTLDVTVKSDNGVGFGTPITQITFDQQAAAGAVFMSAVGPITDDYWRVDWTIGGTTPSFTFAVAVGIF